LADPHLHWLRVMDIRAQFLTIRLSSVGVRVAMVGSERMTLPMLAMELDQLSQQAPQSISALAELHAQLPQELLTHVSCWTTRR
jgi:hypothetical protein